ncbi:hypothetical protein C8A00DRAFT_29261 [Chaetomidium leptoderma]|uniref:Uncharacterized protein n=1 Tax=Chaetomidium leptoderma TaxID=669021 RepID=A0AAN6VXD0_9PEZI|nr:hypothetical protein C8A00DRAFT_29261 [Chaetomidium leptoderma]
MATTSTIFPMLRVANPTKRSLANLPLELTLQILDTIYSAPQIIPIEIFGPKNDDHENVNLQENVSKQTKVVLRPPPLSATVAATCQLFRYMYRKSRPNRWGVHLHNRLAHNVDLKKDIFHVRIHRTVYPDEWDPAGESHLDRLFGILRNVTRMATSVNYVSFETNKHAVNYLRHLHPGCRELMVLVPSPGLDRGEPTSNSEGLRPMEDHTPVMSSVQAHCVPWYMYKKFLRDWMDIQMRHFDSVVPNAELRSLWEKTWRLSPPPEVRGYLVDQDRLNDPNAWGRISTMPF